MKNVELIYDFTKEKMFEANFVFLIKEKEMFMKSLASSCSIRTHNVSLRFSLVVHSMSFLALKKRLK
jgi:hypothetical protein